MSLMNQEKVHGYLKGFKNLYLSTTINGLPSLTCLPFETKLDALDDVLIVIRLVKNSIEYNQLLFNKNCCLLLGTTDDQIKIYGKAQVQPSIDVNEINKEEKDELAIFTVNPDQIVHEKDGKSTILLDKELKVTKNLIKGNFSTEFKFWFQITRAPFFTATIMPILLGIILAWVLNDSFSGLFAIMTLVAGIFIHAGTNLINDFFDQRTDNLNDNSTPFSGGSRTIQLRLATQEKILFSAVTSFVIGNTISNLNFYFGCRNVFSIFLYSWSN